MGDGKLARIAKGDGPDAAIAGRELEDRKAYRYIRMHGADGARAKLTQLKVRKTKTPQMLSQIAALERKLGG